ncbi:PD-(D/E)XK nuclease family transposase [Suicoccus acidiformans]|uniref:PD-(D/E)XK nuclease family transposase n=1 Tax=Suicoccus acidiformans TaxID=2036206 RepID=UPI0013C32493|nr:PD-(D/E)XK nuclease family transposase [Suicoccus acidiformans]
MQLTISTTYTIENYKQTEIITENEGQLLSTEVDVRAVTSSGAIVTIEMQIQLAKTFIDRTQFYAFSTYVNNYANNPAAKDKYASIQDVYSINICDSPLLDPNDRAVRQYELLDLESYESIR